MDISRFKGCILATAIGDSLGAPREGSLEISENRDLGPRYTDDTAMMIGVAESLIHCGGFNGHDMVERFIHNHLKEPWRGYGWGPPRIFNMILNQGRRWDEMLDRGLYPGGSYGNGAAMRIAPIGLFYYDEPDTLREVVHRASIITHSHELAIEGAFLQAYAVSIALTTRAHDLNREGFLMRLKAVTNNQDYLKKLSTIEGLLNQDVSKRDVIRYLGNGIEALNSVPIAIYSFLANYDLEGALVYAVSLGGDADTIGAMTGAIAGAYYGMDAIPLRWTEALENRQYIQGLAERLWRCKEGVNVKD